MKLPSKLTVWCAFWRIIGRVVLNKTFLIVTLLVVTYLLGVVTSRIALNAFYDAGSVVVNKCNQGLEGVGVAYRLDMPNFNPPAAVPVTEDPLLFTDDPLLLPPLDEIVVSE
jgi:hypothetical protein